MLEGWAMCGGVSLEPSLFSSSRRLRQAALGLRLRSAREPRHSQDTVMSLSKAKLRELRSVLYSNVSRNKCSKELR